MRKLWTRNRPHKVHDVVIVAGTVCEIVKIRKENHTTWCVVDNHNGFQRNVPACVIGR